MRFEWSVTKGGHHLREKGPVPSRAAERACPLTSSKNVARRKMSQSDAEGVCPRRTKVWLQKWAVPDASAQKGSVQKGLPPAQSDASAQKGSVQKGLSPAQSVPGPVPEGSVPGAVP